MNLIILFPNMVKTRGDQLPTDGPDHTTRPKGHASFRSRVEFQADNAQLVRSTGANVSVMALQGPKYSPQKSRPLESGHRRHGVCIAIECSYKLDQKNEFKFLCELCTFSQIRSHIHTIRLPTYYIYPYSYVAKLYYYYTQPQCVQ